MDYYLKFREDIRGPYSLTVLRQFTTDDMLSHEHFYSSDQQHWMPIAQLMEEATPPSGSTSFPPLDQFLAGIRPYVQAHRRLLGIAAGGVLLIIVALMLVSEPETLEKKAEKGNAAAQCQLAKHYLAGNNGYVKDERMAAKWFEKAAVQDHAEAQGKLGNMIRMGSGDLQRDLSRAARLFQSAAAKGDAEAQMWLGMFHMGGIGGVPMNEKKGREWLEKSAEQQFGDAQAMLAVMYLEGSGGVRKDTAKSRQLMEKAAENGSDAAKELLGKRKTRW